MLLKEQQRQQLHAHLIAKLRAQHQLKIMIPPPRFDVAAGNRPSMGPANAPITIVEFGDFESAFSKHSEDTLKQVRDRYGDKVRLVFVEYPLKGHPRAFDAARAAQCANEQGKFWPFHDALFADQSKLAASDLKAAAARLKLDTAKFNDCFDKHKYDADINKDIEEGASLGIEATPAFYVNGRPLLGAEPMEKFASIIDEELAATAGTKQARK